MLDHLNLLFYAVAMRIFPHVFPKEETTETKKCMYCLRRVKTFHYKCPHCRTMNFIFDTDLSE
jgi:lipopolysaccharide biosynthesis regulator YciM